jgi:hypothetical protein
MIGLVSCAGAELDEPCGSLPTNPEQKDVALASCLVAGDTLATWPESSSAAPVVLYVDRSGSMRGFLDPAYPSRIGYRSIIDRLIVALNPSQAFGYGSAVQPIPTSIGALGDREFYDDNNTEMEQALELIGRDSTAAATHLLIGDGRRTDPNLANEQYVMMRQLARGWIERGGTFLLAASRAPFTLLEEDPAGCQPAAEAPTSTCPLYAFAFIARGDQTRVVATFANADVFEHVFVWPLPASARSVLTVDQPQPELTFEQSWTTAAGAIPVARVRGDEYTNLPLRARLGLHPASDMSTAAARVGLEGQEFRGRISVRPLLETSAAMPWQAVSGAGSLVSPVPGEPASVDIRSLGSPERHLYRVELIPTGEARWLSDFDAANAGDAERTFGLGRLFELFRSFAQSAEPAPVQRAYVVVN